MKRLYVLGLLSILAVSLWAADTVIIINPVSGAKIVQSGLLSERKFDEGTGANLRRFGGQQQRAARFHGEP